MTKRKWDILKEEKRKECTDKIIGFFNDREEDIGIIAAQDLLDIFLQYAGLDIYNQGIEDTRAFLKSRLEALDIDVLLKR